MTNGYTTTEYVVFSKMLNQYWRPSRSGSLTYNSGDFTSQPKDAVHFKTKQNANERHMALKHHFDTVVVPVYIDAALGDPLDETLLSKKAVESLALVNDLMRMSEEEEDALSNEQIRKYKQAKAYLIRHRLV